MTDDSKETVARLEARVSELTRERDNLAAVVDILQAISGSLHFEEILQTIARKPAKRSGSTAVRSFFRASGKKCGSSRVTKIRRCEISSSTLSVIPS
jgi:hypothetical protein